MKTVLGWLTDPYVHMLLLGLVLMRLAMGAGGDERVVDQARRPVFCATCREPHEDWSGRCRISAALTSLLQSE